MRSWGRCRPRSAKRFASYSSGCSKTSSAKPRPDSSKPRSSGRTPYLLLADAGIVRTIAKVLLVQALHDHRHPLAATHAHRLQAKGLAALLEAVEEGAEDARAGHAERVAERDGSAVRVELVAKGVDADATGRRDDLGREGLVDLHDVDIVDRHPGPLQIGRAHV